jgi:hypothetical protein
MCTYIKGAHSLARALYICGWKYPPRERVSVLLFSVGMSLASLHLSLTRPAHPPARAPFDITYVLCLHPPAQAALYFLLYVFKGPGRW